MIGSTLGPYRVISKVGEGGMGVVYRATDTNLGRDVAIKMLPPSVANDPERLARFEREARLLASLNHANIAAVYGVEQGALIMEMIEGPTLADRLRAQPLSLEETLEIAVQVTEALEAAHDKGIVHRDLKPANIKLAPSGLVKVLDFGLAKAVAEEASADPNNTPTITAAVSRTGIIMGTAAYMSPEQARGGHVDQRTDIWAFGLVLFEMLSRRQMFGGETIADSLAGILKGPIDFNDLPAETPPPIRRLLKRCLERDRRKRLRDIADARLELVAASEEESAAPVAAPAPVKPARRAWLPWAAAGVCLLAALALAGWTLTKPRPPQPLPFRFTASPPPGYKFVSFPALSPDGRRAAWTVNTFSTAGAAGRLYVRDLNSTEARAIENTSSAASPFWSPDSRSVGYYDTSSSRIMKVSIDGTLPEPVASIGTGFGGAVWREDGSILYTTGGKSLSVSAFGGAVKQVTLPGVESGHAVAALSPLPDPQRLLFIRYGKGANQELCAANLASGTVRTLTTSTSRAQYDSGHLLYVRDGILTARPFDLNRLEFTGEPFRVASPVDTNNTGRLASFAASGNGVLMYRQPSETVLSLQWYTREGKELGPLQQSVIVGNHHEVSPDGGRVAFGTSANSDTNGDIWVTDVARGVNSRLTSHPALDWVPAWSPDGRRLAFTSTRDSQSGRDQLYVLDTDRPGSEKPLLVDDRTKHHLAWSPDGKTIVYEARAGEDHYDLWAVPVEGGGKPRPVIATEFNDAQPAFSPDGRWLAYISNRTGRFEVYIREFATGDSAAVVQVSTNGGIQPRWRKDGKELCYLAADGFIMSVPVQSATAAFIPGNPARLFRTELLGIRASTHYTMTPDGQRFLLPSSGTGVRQEPYVFMVNWAPPRP